MKLCIKSFSQPKCNINQFKVFVQVFLLYFVFCVINGKAIYSNEEKNASEEIIQLDTDIEEMIRDREWLDLQPLVMRRYSFSMLLPTADFHNNFNYTLLATPVHLIVI